MANFISLHNHTHYSLLNSLISPKDLFARAKELNQNAVAITDYGSLAGIWEALKISKETDVKLIVGCELYFVDDATNWSDKLRYIVFLVKNYVGYKNLLALSKNAFDNSSVLGKKVYPIVDWKLIEKYSEGLICLTACGNGIIGQLLNNKNFDEAENAIQKLKAIFGSNLGIEVQAHNLTRNATHYSNVVNQVFTNNHCIRLANKYNVKIVPTCNSHYLKREDAEVHDVLLAIGAMQPTYSNARIKYNVSDLYLKTADEIVAFFSRNFGEDFAKDICENTKYFSDLCEQPDWVDPKHSNPSGKELPRFPVEQEIDFREFSTWREKRGDEIKNLDLDKAYLHFKCGLTFGKKVPLDKRAIYLERLKEELDVIEYHGFSSYMLIVADYVNWAKKNGIMVGPGRGSVGGSLIGYLLDIHEADPIQYKLIFARFHNKDKTSFPDIDCDFSPSGRDRVQEYIRNKYGNDFTAHVSNINAITPKVFAKDVARSCEIGGSRQAAVEIGAYVADSIPKKIGEKEIRTFDDAANKAPLFGEYLKKYPQYQKYSSICGQYRAWSTHAAGLVISKRPLVEFVPLRKDKDGAIAIEFDKERAEENGLVKMDLLGLETLDIIDNTHRLIKEAGKPLPASPPNYDEYDKETYDLITRGDTACVFQLGTSAGTIDLCKKIKPKTIEDISHINSLARPSARDIRENFIATKDGRMKSKLMHPSLQRAFGGTFGFGLYEESLMYLAQDVAGWSLHGADRLRKLTKEKGKNPKKALQWRSEFIADAKKNNNIDEKISMKIWDEVIEKFQGYGFNLAHSIMYSMISYHTAYLKAHYPIEFLLANLMSELKSNAKVAKDNIDRIKQEIRAKGIKIIPPNINNSDIIYKVLPNNVLITGLKAIESMGDDVRKDLVSKRPYKSFDDFMIKIDGSKVKSNTIQALAASGCFDDFGIPRKLIYMYCSDYRKKLQVWAKKHDIQSEKFEYPWPVENDWTPAEKYALEMSYMNEVFSCGKKEAYGNFFRNRSFSIKEIMKMNDRDKIPSIRAIIKNIFEFNVKKETSKFFGQPMAKALIEDEFGDQMSLTVFPDRWQQVRARMKELCGSKFKFEPGIAIHISGTLNMYDDELGIILENFYDFSPPPPLPKDLKIKKKVSIKRTAKDKTKDMSADGTDAIIDDIENELFNEGLIDLNDEDSENDDI